LRHPNQVLTRTRIFERVWRYDFGPDSNLLEVYIGYLRRKLERDGEPRLIHTIRGSGYLLGESAMQAGIRTIQRAIRPSSDAWVSGLRFTRMSKSSTRVASG
jgi:DNA-binding winged helix-turn-helix (wHTH) protein